MIRANTAFIWAGVAVFIIVLYIVLHVFVMGSFAELEDNHTRENIHRLLDAINERTMSISSKASDWAAWDDAYEFVQDRNSRFIRSNFALSAFTGNNLNLIAYTDNSGRIVYARWYNPGTNKMVPIPDDVRRIIGKDSFLTNHPDARHYITGIVMLKQGPMLTASRPVVTSNEEGPIRGSLLFGQLLDSEEVQNLSRITHVPVTIERLDDGDLPADFARARAAISRSKQAVVEPINRHLVAGFMMLNDIYGEPALMLRVEMLRTIYNRGLTVTNYTLAALVILGILFASIGSLLLIRTVQKEREFDSRTREFYRSTIKAATSGKLIMCEKNQIPTSGELLGKWDIPHPEDVSLARNEVAEIAQREGMDEPTLTDFVLCVGESITNSVKHGGGGTASLYNKNDTFRFIVSDHGPGIEALAIPELALKPRYTTAASLGVGYKVMISLADKVYLATGPKGTTVAMEKKIDCPACKEEDYWISETWNA